MASKKFGAPLAGLLAESPERAKSDMVFVGLPDDCNSSFCRGPAAGPEWIRRAYDSGCYNASTEMGVDLGGIAADLGDWPPRSTWQKTCADYREKAADLFRSGKIPFFAGGDHAVTVPVVDALSVLDKPVHVIQLDAHPDMYPELDGNPDSHACTGRLILEMGHVASLTQIGVRAITKVQLEVAERFGERLQLFPARSLEGRLPALPHIPMGADVYLSIDLDAFDPAFAPGVSHPVPGGLTSREVINFVQDFPWNMVGMDVVELNRDRDVNDLTAILAGGLFHEAMGMVTAARAVCKA